MPRPQSFDVAEALPPGIGVTGKHGNYYHSQSDLYQYAGLHRLTSAVTELET
jgi:hypothetical protein